MRTVWISGMALMAMAGVACATGFGGGRNLSAFVARHMGETGIRAADREAIPASAVEPKRAEANEAPSWHQRHHGDLSWHNVVYSLSSPAQVCDAVRRRVTFVEDEFDHWQTPQETWDRRKGDCEDFALLIAELCRQMGFEVWIQVFYPAGGLDGHAIAMGRHTGRLWMANDGRYREVGSVEEAGFIVARSFNWNPRTLKSAMAMIDKRAPVNVAEVRSALPDISVGGAGEYQHPTSSSYAVRLSVSMEVK